MTVLRRIAAVFGLSPWRCLILQAARMSKLAGDGTQQGALARDARSGRERENQAWGVAS